MSRLHQTTAVVAILLALVSHSSLAQQGSLSLTHTVTVTVPPRVKVDVTPTVSRTQQLESGRIGFAVRINATRGWALVVGSKDAGRPAQWVASKGDRFSSMVLYRNYASQRTPENGGASDSEPVMLTVVAP